MKDKTLVIAVAVVLSVATIVVASNTGFLQIMRVRPPVNTYNTTATLISPGIGQSVSLPVDIQFSVYTEAPNPYYAIYFTYVIDGQTHNYIKPHTALPQDGIVSYSFNPAELYGRAIWVDWYVLMYNNDTRIWNNEDAHWAFSVNGGSPPPPPNYITLNYYLTNMFPSSYDASSLPRAPDFTGPVGYWYIDTDNEHLIYRYPDEVDDGIWTIDLKPSYDGGTIWKNNWAVTEMPYTVANKSIDMLYVPYQNELPVASFTFTPESIIAGQPVYFDGSASYDPDGTIVGWNWDFGDGYKISGPNHPTVNHTYSEGGTYIVTLEVVDNVGGTGSTSKTISVEHTYLLTVVTSGDGSVSVSPYSPDNKYVEGTEITLTATPSANWVFDHWEGGVNGSQNPTSFKISGDTVVTAYFSEKQQYTVTVSAEPTGGGIVTLKPSGGTYDVGNNIAVTAIPNNGYRFDHWSGDVTGTQNPVVLTIDSDKTIVAHFEKTKGNQMYFLPFLLAIGLIAVAGGIYYNNRKS